MVGQTQLMKRLHWQKIVDDFHASGLTQKKFCIQKNIKYFTLHYWLYHFKKSTPSAKKNPTTFLPVNIVSEEAQAIKNDQIKVFLPNGVTILIEPEFNPIMLRKVIEALR